MLKYPFYEKLISTELFSQMQKITGLEEKFQSKSCFLQHKIVFFPRFPHTLPSFATKV